MAAGTIPVWKPESLGSGKWTGRLDPLEVDLRRLILHCGDLCQVTYDSFNSDPNSAYCGSCRYSKATLLDKVLFPAAGDLSVVEYLYATSQVPLPVGFLLFSQSREAWSKESNWIGYVAVSSDSAAAAAGGRRFIYVAWRGTIRNFEWVDVLDPELVPLEGTIMVSAASAAESKSGRPKVMKGWHVMYWSSDERSPFTKTSTRDQLLATVRNLVDRYKDEKVSIVCTGHSLGAALATLCAFDIALNGLPPARKDIAVAVIGFGSPQVGNREFKERLDKIQNLHVLRVDNKHDVIPKYPSGLLGFEHVGVELVVDSNKSPYLKQNTGAGDYHNLQGILHTVAGWNGDDKDFKDTTVQRSVALVNKSSSFLRDDTLIPGSWWVEKNKGMVLGSDGVWRLQPPAEENLPIPPPSLLMMGKKDAGTAAGPGRGSHH